MLRSVTMNNNEIFAAAFLGVFGVALFYSQATTILTNYSRPTAEWVARHALLPKIFRGRHFFNPTRIELLFHLAHWVLTIIYNTYDVHNLSQAATRASQLAVIHVIPLLATHQLSFVSDNLGLPLNGILKIHASLGLMALIQGILHSLIEIQVIGEWGSLAISGAIVRPLSLSFDLSYIR